MRRASRREEVQVGREGWGGGQERGGRVSRERGKGRTKKNLALQSDKGPSCSDLGLLRSGNSVYYLLGGPVALQSRSKQHLSVGPLSSFIALFVAVFSLLASLSVLLAVLLSLPLSRGFVFSPKTRVCLCIGFLPASAYQRMRASVGITMPKSGQERSITRD